MKEHRYVMIVMIVVCVSLGFMALDSMETDM